LPAVPAAAGLVAAALLKTRRPEILTFALAGLVLVGTLVLFHAFPDRVAEPTTARDFVRRIPTTRPGDVRLFHLQSATNVILFHLGRAEPPSKIEELIVAARREGSIRVATNPDGAAKLAERGFEVRLLLRTGEPGERTYLLLDLRLP
jgi:hypothetical protein